MNTTPTLLTVYAAAERRGVHHGTIRRWIRESLLPAVRLSDGSLRIDAADLDAVRPPKRVSTRLSVVPELTDAEWLEAFRAPRGTYSTFPTTEPRDALAFWRALFNVEAEYVGVTIVGRERWLVQPPAGQAIIVELVPHDAPNVQARGSWVPTAAVDDHAPDRLRAAGFTVRDGQAITPDGDVVNLSVADAGFGITGWNLVQAEAVGA